MREIGIVPGEREARTLSDYLLTREITTKLVPAKQGWSLWVHDEDRVGEASEALRSFLADPDDDRYKAATDSAREVRKRLEAAERAHRKHSHELILRWEGSPWRRYPASLALIVVAVVVFLLTGMGEDRRSTAYRALLFSDYSFVEKDVDGEGIVRPISHGFDDILRGQVWRLVTPIFLHFGVLHLFFNASVMRAFGGMIELRKGTPRFLLLVLVSAVASDVAQYVAQSTEHELVMFGGLSGVNYALFGYLWVKRYYHPEDGLGVSTNNIGIMLGWFLLCMTGWFQGMIGPVANTAHGVGLGVGMLFGLLRF